MARIGILTCSNCTQESNCASVVCLGDMRKRRGFFERYAADEPLELVGIINCAGCPTLAAPEKILRRVRAVAEFKIDALHLSFCMTALCPFINTYSEIIKEEYPNIEVVMGTHTPGDRVMFQKGVKELLCQTLAAVQTMSDMIRKTIKIPQD
jgi:predicted metal-binding protein